MEEYGLTEAHHRANGPVEVDLMLVPGPNGHPHETWTSDRTMTFWPADRYHLSLGTEGGGTRVRIRC